MQRGKVLVRGLNPNCVKHTSHTPTDCMCDSPARTNAHMHARFTAYVTARIWTCTHRLWCSPPFSHCDLTARYSNKHRHTHASYSFRSSRFLLDNERQERIAQIRSPKLKKSALSAPSGCLQQQWRNTHRYKPTHVSLKSHAHTHTHIHIHVKLKIYTLCVFYYCCTEWLGHSIHLHVHIYYWVSLRANVHAAVFAGSAPRSKRVY